MGEGVFGVWGRVVLGVLSPITRGKGGIGVCPLYVRTPGRVGGRGGYWSKEEVQAGLAQGTITKEFGEWLNSM